ncbi:hypothetical protein KX816_02465 [Sphingosinicellaceae bacterium]|nr:hypothetical protein KX816_02465 [Sphingosinicellaceae bacterium]
MYPQKTLMLVDNAPVLAAAMASPLVAYFWPDKRGVAPRGYTKGMGVAFAQAYRMLKAQDRFMVKAAGPRTGSSAHDVLDWYEMELAAAGAKTSTAADRLISVFAIMLGLGMRESSGRHCDGPDTAEDRGPRGRPVPTTPDNAEAGLFQVSYDSIHGDTDRQALVKAFAGRQDLMDIFGEGASCTKPNHWPADVGRGQQAAFQNQMKECPLFATLYTAMFLRQERGHWGPINRKKAEARSDAVILFGQIKAIVDDMNDNVA